MVRPAGPGPARFAETRLLAIVEPPAAPLETIRIDLWAWSVRLFKTRSLAATACRKSQLLVNGQRCRAAKPVRVGDLVQVRGEGLTRTFEITGLLRRRVGAKEVPRYLVDHTPPEDIALAAEAKASTPPPPQRESGSGRPTKRDRRDIDRAQSSEDKPGTEVTPSFEQFLNRYLGRG